MRVTIYTITVGLLLLSNFVFAQKGIIKGTVLDGKTSEVLPGVTVMVEGTTKGTITDLDGNFNLPIEPGIYRLRISFISYQILYLDSILVEAEKTTLLDQLKLEEATIEIGEATVVAKKIRNTESAMLSMKKKSANVIDGISSAALKKTGDSNAASSLKRVTGVSVQGGKYVFVRGLGDRYTKTILNGLDIPGLDPDRNSLQMDIFPTGMIDNIVVNKSFSAELPADFTGGVININIKDFPETRKASITASSGYNSTSHFRSDFLTYDGGKTDWLGYDDGTRAIPASNNIPLFSEVVGNPSGEEGLRYQKILQSFNPQMAAKAANSFMDFSLEASFGDLLKIGKYSLGYILSASYKNNTDFYENAVYSQFGLSTDANITELEVREYQQGNYGVKNVLLSGLAGIALKSKQAKYRLSVLHLQNGTSQAGIFDYQKSNLGTSFSGFQHNLEYSQRELSNILLDGKYSNIEKKWEIAWKISPTISKLSNPDIRFTRYENRNGNYSIGTEVGFPERIWRDLNEINLAGALHFSKNITVNNQDATLKMGGAYTFKERNFDSRSYAINVRNIPLTGNPNELFRPENLWPYNGNIARGTTYEAPFTPVNPNQFNSSVNYAAAYLSLEMVPVKNLKTIIGIRVENYSQKYTGQDQLGINVLDNEKVLDNTGVFPTANFIFNVNEKQNIRFSFSKTIARPSFKELSYAEIFDPISGRTFIGGMFRDADDIAGIEYWDGKLVSTDIYNFDLRWEMFHKYGQTISSGVFYKRFKNPIEMVEYATQTGAFQPRNVGDGSVLGTEFEIRQSLKPLSEGLKNISVNMNLTYSVSQIKLSKTEYNSRVSNARSGQVISKTREMAGQAPYVINIGVNYSGSEAGITKNVQAGLFYNVQGPTLQYVGLVDRPDVYIVPFNSLNFNATKHFGKNDGFVAGLKIDNILNDKIESVYKSYHAAKQYFAKRSTGTTFELKIGYNF